MSADLLEELMSSEGKLTFINWVVRALNADCLTAVVYQTIYHGYDKTFIFTALITLITSGVCGIWLIYHGYGLYPGTLRCNVHKNSP